MDLWTIQLAQWRVAKARGIAVLNTTAKDGDQVFAPTWDIVMAVKNKEITPAQYTYVYLTLMRSSYQNHRKRWLEVLRMPHVAFACYCPDGVFCHRHVLADVFVKVGAQQQIECFLKGELKRPQD